jgi:hypothetical protein
MPDPPIVARPFDRLARGQGLGLPCRVQSIIPSARRLTNAPLAGSITI